MGHILVTEAEERVALAASAVACPQCHVPAGQECITIGARLRYRAGSPHLGRARAAGVMHLLPLVEAMERGEFR